MADPALLGAAAESGRRARVAIASYEFTGIVRNGGIGTACTSLACALAADGHEVELVFTGWPEDPSDESFQRWQSHYRDLGVRLDRLDLSTVWHCDGVLYNTAHSLALYELLRDRDRERPYDAIHFVESLAHGLYPLLAKRQGLAFARATTVVGVHSPRRWLAEAHGVPFDHPIELGDEFMERRGIELADVVVSPSAHMLDWLERRGTRLPERSFVQQYVTNFDLERDDRGGTGEAREEAEPAQIEELVFFGRLEPRKGLTVFCDALDGLLDGEPGALRRVTFLGKQVPFGDVLSGEYLRERSARWPWECTVIDDLDRDAALDYLHGPGRVAVMASLMDNSPNTVYEAIGLGIAFLASRGGGTAELVHPEDFERVTYEPGDSEEREIDPGDPARSRPRQTGRVLARRLERLLADAPRPARYAVDPAANRKAHLAWHRGMAAQEMPPAPEPCDAPEPIDVRDVSDAAVDGELVLLLDPDVEREPALASALATAAAATPDAAFFTPLGSFDVGTADGPVRRVFLPAGGPPVVGLLGNCFGAGAMLGRRDALERIGAFDREADSIEWTVADLLARAALAGERIDVVPEVLYHLPATAVPGGSLTTSQSTLEAIRPFYGSLSPAVRDIASATRRLMAEDAALRAGAERAEQAAADASARLAAVTASRSYRVTRPLRAVASWKRRLLGRAR